MFAHHEVARPPANVNGAVVGAEERGVRHADEEAGLEHSRDALDLHVQTRPVRRSCDTRYTHSIRVLVCVFHKYTSTNTVL